MTLTELKALLDEGKFHHATYRYELAPGLHIYQRDTGSGHAFRGFEHVGYFSESLTDKVTMNAAYEMVRKTGVSTGSYGEG